jgi:hypothetical protein
MTAGPFTTPTGPVGPWDQLSKNERTWIEFIRIISGGCDPKVTPERVRRLTELLDAG